MSDSINHIATNEHVEAEEQLRDVPQLLLPYQQAWVADTSPVKIYEKSRRIGISWAEAGDDALFAASTNGSNVYYISYEKEMTRQFIDDCAWWAKWYNLAASEVQEEVFEDEDGKAILSFRIDFASGHHIQALSSKPRNLRSKQGRVVFDEFAFHDDPDELMKAALALLVWGGQVRIISTHHGIDNAFNKLVEDARSGKKPYSVHRTTFAEAIDQGLFRRICLMKGNEWTQEGEDAWMAEIYAQYGEGAAEELDVIPSKGGGKYFSRVLVEACMDKHVPVLRLNLDDEFAQLPDDIRRRRIAAWLDEHVSPHLTALNDDLKSFYGLDFGRTGDLSYLLVGQQEANLSRRSALALEMRNVPFAVQTYVLDYIIERLPRFISGAHDAGGDGSALAESMAEHWGFQRIHQIKFTRDWYLENFPRYRAGIQDGKVVLPADADLLDDHGDVELVAGVPRVPDTKRRKGSDGGQRHGDGAVAAVLWWFASEQGGAPIEYQSAGPTSTSATVDRFLGSGRMPAGHITDTGFGTIGGTTNLRNF